MYANVHSQRHGLAIERLESVWSSKVLDSGAKRVTYEIESFNSNPKGPFRGRWYRMALFTYIQNSTERKNIVHSCIYPEWVRTCPLARVRGCWRVLTALSCIRLARCSAASQPRVFAGASEMAAFETLLPSHPIMWPSECPGRVVSCTSSCVKYGPDIFEHVTSLLACAAVLQVSVRQW